MPQHPWPSVKVRPVYFVSVCSVCRLSRYQFNSGLKKKKRGKRKKCKDKLSDNVLCNFPGFAALWKNHDSRYEQKKKKNTESTYSRYKVSSAKTSNARYTQISIFLFEGLLQKNDTTVREEIRFERRYLNNHGVNGANN